MLDVLLVESSKAMVQVYKKMIPWEMYGFTIASVCDSEQQAIEAIFEQEPAYWEAINQSADACTADFMIQSRYGYTARFDGQKRLIIAALTGEMEIEQALSQLDTEINQSL